MTHEEVIQVHGLEWPDVYALGMRRDCQPIYMFIGGSQLHGAKLEGTDDTDWYGVFMEPRELVLGLDRNEHFVYSTAAQDRKNTAADLDVTLYSLRRWAELACKGNPSVLHFLFAPTPRYHFIWGKLALRRELFLSRNHAKQFFGFAHAQMHKLYNKQPRDVRRIELEETYGFDTKYAMHIIRLYQECIEYLSTGTITLPRPNAAELIGIRKGERSLEEIKQLADSLEAECIALEGAPSGLRLKPDRVGISRLLAELYEEYWDSQEAVNA